LRALAATVVVFGASGFGPGPAAAPHALRAYETLWVLPRAVSGGARGTVLGFANVALRGGRPRSSSPAVWLGDFAVRRRGGRPELDLERLGWPVLLMGVVSSSPWRRC